MGGAFPERGQVDLSRGITSREDDSDCRKFHHYFRICISSRVESVSAGVLTSDGKAERCSETRTQIFCTFPISVLSYESSVWTVFPCAEKHSVVYYCCPTWVPPPGTVHRRVQHPPVFTRHLFFRPFLISPTVLLLKQAKPRFLPLPDARCYEKRRAPAEAESTDCRLP